MTKGFQTRLEWMGKMVTTLADVPPREGGIVLVGINPAPKSVELGHYYQGQVGQGVWARLRSVDALRTTAQIGRTRRSKLLGMD